MSDDSIRDAFALEERATTATHVSLNAAYQRVRQSQRHQRVLLLSNLGVVAGISAAGWVAYSLTQNVKTNKPAHALVAGSQGTPMRSPSPEWHRMAGVYEHAMARGIYLDISYPNVKGRRQFWRDATHWRDETPLRVWGFNGTREWVWLRKSGKVFTWDPKNKMLDILRRTESPYAQPHLLRLLITDSKNDVAFLTTSDKPGELLWKAYDSLYPSDYRQTFQFAIDASTLLPRSEECKVESAKWWDSVNVGDYAPSFSDTVTSSGGGLAALQQAPPFFILFPRYADSNKRKTYYSAARPIIPLPVPLPSSTSPKVPASPIVYRARVSYGITPKAGFEPPKGMPIVDLAERAKRWESHLKQSRLAALRGPHFQSMIRHASRDQQGNVYLLYTGNELLPETFRKQRRLTLEFPGYTAMEKENSMHRLLPKTIDGEPLRLLMLVPLQLKTIAQKTIALRWTDVPTTGESHANNITLPLTTEANGPECLYIEPNPPTRQQRQRWIGQIIQLAAARASGRIVDTWVPELFEASAKETWNGEPPWQVSMALAQLEQAAQRKGQAYQLARQAYLQGKRQTEERPKEIDSSLSPRGPEDQLAVLKTMVSELEM